jgi:hypothetical protein
VAQYATLPDGSLDTFWLAQNESVYVWLGRQYNNGGGQLCYWEPTPLYTGGQVPTSGNFLQCSWSCTTGYTSVDPQNTNTLISFVRLVTNTSTVVDSKGGATFAYFYVDL